MTRLHLQTLTSNEDLPSTMLNISRCVDPLHCAHGQITAPCQSRARQVRIRCTLHQNNNSTCRVVMLVACWTPCTPLVTLPRTSHTDAVIIQVPRLDPSQQRNSSYGVILSSSLPCHAAIEGRRPHQGVRPTWTASITSPPRALSFRYGAECRW